MDWQGWEWARWRRRPNPKVLPIAAATVTKHTQKKKAHYQYTAHNSELYTVAEVDKRDIIENTMWQKCSKVGSWGNKQTKTNKVALSFYYQYQHTALVSAFKALYTCFSSLCLTNHRESISIQSKDSSNELIGFSLRIYHIGEAKKAREQCCCNTNHIKTHSQQSHKPDSGSLWLTSTSAALPFGPLKYHLSNEVSFVTRRCTPATWIRHGIYLFIYLFI